MRPESDVPVKILIVNDNPFDQFVLCNELELGSIIINVANSAFEATGMIEKSFYSLIIVDPFMQHQSGFELLKYLKDGEKTTHIPIVFFSTKENSKSRIPKQLLESVDMIPLCSEMDLLKGHLNSLIEMANYRRQILIEKNKMRTELNKYKLLIENFSPQYVFNYNGQIKKPVTAIHENATVMFTGFTNFERFAKKSNPKDLAKRMDIYFQKLNEIMESYEVDKIYTVGDAVISASGMQKGDAQSVVKMILVALEMQYFSNNLAKIGFPKEKESLGFKCAISTGSIVSDITNHRPFDIWGDAVSEAVALKRITEQPKIIISESTSALVADTFEIESLGFHQTGYKGQQEIFEVRNIKEAHPNQWADLISNQLYLP